MWVPTAPILNKQLLLLDKQTVLLFWSSQAEQTKLFQQQKFLRFSYLAPSKPLYVYPLPALYCSSVSPPTQNTATPPTDVQVSGNTNWCVPLGNTGDLTKWPQLRPKQFYKKLCRTRSEKSRGYFLPYIVTVAEGERRRSVSQNEVI